MSELGTIRGQMILDINQALAAYTKVRREHLNTVTALQTGGGALVTAGAGVAAAGAAMAGGFIYAATKAGEFERKLDYFSAVSSATQAEYDAIREKALQLGADTIYSADQIAESFVELGKAGVGPKDIIDGIGEAVANLGAAADIPLDAASNILMAAVQTFGLSADEAVGVADKMAGAANASMIDIQDLGTSLKYAGGVARTLGLDFDDVNTAIAILGQYGIRGSTAGTSLRQMMVSLTGKTKPATKALTELGIITEDGTNRFFDAEGNAKSLSEVFQILQDATAGLTSEQKLNYLRQIFQNRALAAASALTQSGAEGFTEMYEAIGKTTAMGVANERLDNLSGDIEILKGNIETLVIDTGSGFQTFARSLVQGITTVIQAFSNLPSWLQSSIIGFLAFSAVALVIVGSLGMFAGSILQIIGLIMRIGPALSGLKTGLAVVRTAMLGVNAAFLANPITWIIVGIVALIAAFIWLWNNVEGFRNFWIAVWDVIKSAAAAVWDWLQSLPGWFAGVWNSIVTGVSAFVEGVVLFFQELPGRIVAFFTQLGTDIATFWTNLTTSVSTAVSNFINSIVVFFQELPGKIGAFFAALPYLIGYSLGLIIGTIVRWAIDTYSAITAWATNTYNAVVDWFSKLPGRVVAFFTQVYNGVVTWLKNALTQAILKSIAIYNGIVDWLQKLPGKVIGFFTDLYNGAVRWLNDMATQAVIKAMAIYNGIVDWLQKLPGKVVGFFTTLAQDIATKLNEAVDKAVTLAGKIYNGVVNGITGIPGQVSAIFGKVVGAVRDKITSAFNAVRDFAAGLWNGFKEGLGIHSPSYIEHAMWAITDVVDEETNRLKGQVKAVQDLGNGISEVGNNLGFDTRGMAADVNDLAKSVWAVRQYQDELASLASTYAIAPDPSSLLTPGANAAAAQAEQSRAASALPPVQQNITIPMPPEVAASASAFFDWLNQLGVEAHQFGNTSVTVGD